MGKEQVAPKGKQDWKVDIVEDVFGASPLLAETLKRVCETDKPRVFIVADMNLVQRTPTLGSKIGRYVQDFDISLAASPLVIFGGEKVKADGLKVAIQVISGILSTGLRKRDAIVVMGGGSLLDVVGYAAAQVCGGMPIVRLPTTPAAMVEGTFAEYAAVDGQKLKDALRVKSTPAAVLIDPNFACTVLDGVWYSGFGEAVRLALATDAALFRKLVKMADGYKTRDEEILQEFVRSTVATRKKKGGVSLGLWVAQRLESMSSYKLPHGYAVTIGLMAEVAYSTAIGRFKQKDKELVFDILRASGATEGISHSHYLLGQTDAILKGIDDWRLVYPDDEISLPAGIGKVVRVSEVDHAVYSQILKELISVPTAP